MGNSVSGSTNPETAKLPKLIILKTERENERGGRDEAPLLPPPVDENKNKNTSMTKKKKEEIVLPPEVIMEILSWLPLKPFTRAQLVCKEWLQLTQDHQLKRKHMNRSPHSRLWYNVNNDAAPNRATPAFCYLHGCDGLLLMRNNTTLKTLLWNPAAKLLLHLPDPHSGLRCGVALSFAQATKTYKVAYFFNISNKLGCQLLTLGGGPPFQWRRLGFPPQEENPNMAYAEVSVVPAGGVPHCTVLRKDGAEIVSVDVETELLTLNHLPGGAFADVGGAKAIDCDGKLGFAAVDIDEQEVQVMVLQDFKKKRWCRNKEVIPLPFLKDEGFIKGKKKLVPLMIKEGEVWFLLGKEKVFVYTIETGKVRDEVRDARISITVSSILYRYKPSMITVEGMGADDEIERIRPSFLS